MAPVDDQLGHAAGLYSSLLPSSLARDLIIVLLLLAVYVHFTTELRRLRARARFRDLERGFVVGPAGPAGPTGPAGPPGPAAAAKVKYAAQMQMLQSSGAFLLGCAAMLSAVVAAMRAAPSNLW